MNPLPISIAVNAPSVLARISAKSLPVRPRCIDDCNSSTITPNMAETATASRA